MSGDRSIGTLPTAGPAAGSLRLSPLAPVLMAVVAGLAAALAGFGQLARPYPALLLSLAALIAALACVLAGAAWHQQHVAARWVARPPVAPPAPSITIERSGQIDARHQLTGEQPPPFAAAAATEPTAPAAAALAAALAAEHAAFNYTVTHDLRAPLRVVEGFGRILKEDYGAALDRIGNDHLDRMVAAAARMNHMIDALLALAQLSAQPLAQQPVNLSQLAQFVVDDLRRAQPERQVLLTIQPGLVVRGDPTLLRTALDNLIGNAWKYSARQIPAAIGFEQTAQDGRAVFVVHDNGAGFDMRFADRLFGAFQRLHSSSEFQGTGVGLTSVQRIVQRHGGQIWAEAEVGRGARFYFTLAG